MIVGGLDLETQSLDLTTNITEIGFRLMEVNGKIWDRKDGFSTLCYEPEYPPQTDLIVELTGITDDELRRVGRPRKETIEVFLMPWLQVCDVIFIHNKAFDWNVLGETCRKLGIALPQKEVICTKNDMDWPSKFQSKRLQHLAIDHLIHFNPKEMHRALNDVDLMFQILAHYDINEILDFVRQPWMVVQAHILEPWKDNGVQRDQAKKFGFSWEQVRDDFTEKYPKAWVKRIKRGNFEKFQREIDSSPCPFLIREAKNDKTGIS